MIKGGVARWSMAYFASAFIAFLIAQVLIVSGATFPNASLNAPATLVAVHLLTIGWLTILILGALRQFVPVITASRPVADSLAGAALVVVDAGLFGMILGFVGLNGGFGLSPSPWLPVGGTLVIIGVVAVAITLAGLLWRARPLPISARFVAVGLAFLLATVGLGVSLASALAIPGLSNSPMLGRLLGSGVGLHAEAGLAGWFTLTAMGVGYKLLAMFTLAPEERGALGDWAFRSTAGGLALAAAAGLAGVAWGAPQTTTGSLITDLAWLGWAAAIVGLALYLADMRRLFGQRRRKELELNGHFAAWALAALAVGALLLLLQAVAAAEGAPKAPFAPIVYLLLFGWLSGLALSQLYKIVPFLTWIERFGSKLGKGVVPRVQDLVDEPRARPWFVLYFAGVTLGALAGLLGLGLVWRFAVLATLVATLAVGLELWRARHADPKPSAPVRPPWLAQAGAMGAAKAGAAGTAQAGAMGAAQVGSAGTAKADASGAKSAVPSTAGGAGSGGGAGAAGAAGGSAARATGGASAQDQGGG